MHSVLKTCNTKYDEKLENLLFNEECEEKKNIFLQK